jgi:hypothetical protein
MVAHRATDNGRPALELYPGSLGCRDRVVSEMGNARGPKVNRSVARTCRCGGTLRVRKTHTRPVWHVEGGQPETVVVRLRTCESCRAERVTVERALDHVNTPLTFSQDLEALTQP